jgi:hypothetical protein
MAVKPLTSKMTAIAVSPHDLGDADQARGARDQQPAGRQERDQLRRPARQPFHPREHTLTCIAMVGIVMVGNALADRRKEA